MLMKEHLQQNVKYNIIKLGIEITQIYKREASK